MKFLRLSALLLVLIVTACAERAVEESVVVQQPEVTRIEEKTVTYSSEVAALRNKGLAQAKYSYSFHSLVRDEFGNLQATADFDVVVFQDKVKKSYQSPQKRGSAYYTDFYIDNAARTAAAVCVQGGVLCQENFNNVKPMDYNSQKLEVTLKDVLDDIPPEAKVAESALVDNRKATVVQYGNVKVYLDNYFGVPLKKQVSDSEGMTEEYTFSRFDIGVKEEDVEQ